MSTVIECTLCPRKCRLDEYQRGDCRVRVNVGGEMFTLVHGRPVAVHIDPMEKKPLFHFLPGSSIYSLATAGCNLHCKYCQNWTISQEEPENILVEELPPDELVMQAADAGCRSIAYTYSEPVVFFEYVRDSSIIARRKGMFNVLVTAAYIEEKPLRELCRYVDAANIDLKGDDDFYRKVCGGRLEPVRRAIKVMQEEGVWIELTHLVVPTLNDDIAKCREMVQWVLDNVGPDVPLHFSRFTPMYKLTDLPPTSPDTLAEFRSNALDMGMRYVYIGNIPGDEGNSTYCPACGETVVGRYGYTLMEFNIVNGRCAFCNEPIAGIWGADMATEGFTKRSQ